MLLTVTQGANETIWGVIAAKVECDIGAQDLIFDQWLF
jgi:hypothetical protein